MIRVVHQRHIARREDPTAAAFAQMRDQAADLIRETWHGRPDLADSVINAKAFDALVRALDRRATAAARGGQATTLDARSLLAAIPLDKISDPTIRDRAAFTTYLVTRLADRLQDEHQARERAARQREIRQQRHELAAEIIRDAWNHHSIAADRAINGPAFPVLARRITGALDAGHTLEHVTSTIASISATAITSTRIGNPSAYLATAFTRNIATMATKVSSSMTPTPHSNEAHSGVRATLGPPWRTRELGHLTDHQLANAATTADQRIEQLTEERATLQQRITALRADIHHERGPHVTKLDGDLHKLQTQRTQVERYEQLQAWWGTHLDAAARHAATRADAEYQVNTLIGRRDGHRRADLQQRIDQLNDAEQRAHELASELAEQAEPLRRQLGDTNQRRLAVEAASAAEAGYLQAHREAIEADARLLTSTASRLLTVDEQISTTTQHKRTVANELQFRASAPALAQALETYQRTNEIGPERAMDPGSEVVPPEPQVDPVPQLTPIREPTTPAGAVIEHQPAETELT